MVLVRKAGLQELQAEPHVDFLSRLVLMEISDHRRTGRDLEHHVDLIFYLCLFIYMGVFLLWTVYWYFSYQVYGDARLADSYTFLICLSWGMVSVCMHVLNKSVVDRTQAPALIATIQMLLAMAFMAPVSTYQLFQAKGKQLCCWLVVPLIFGCAVCTSSFSYAYISLSLYTIIRNLAPLVVMPLERILMGRDKQSKITPLVSLALLTMLAGATLYVESLHEFSWTGIFFVVLNMVLAVTDRFLQRHLLTEECKDLPTNVCTLINNAVGVIPCVVVSLASHEIRDARHLHASEWAHPHNILLIILSGTAGLGICFLGFECQRQLSVTSFYVMQNFMRVILIIVGVTLFKDPLKGPLPSTGMALSVVGSLIYGREQLKPLFQRERLKSESMIGGKVPS